MFSIAASSGPSMTMSRVMVSRVDRTASMPDTSPPAMVMAVIAWLSTSGPAGISARTMTLALDGIRKDLSWVPVRGKAGD